MPTHSKKLHAFLPSWLKTAPAKLHTRLRDNRGTASITFILCLPIFLFFVAIICQYALLANAKLVVEQAAQAAARSTVTSLSDDRPDRVYRAAYMALTPLSPAVTPIDAEGTQVQDALNDLGAQPFSSYSSRFTYAKNATEVLWTSPRGSFVDNEAQPIEVTVNYQMPLTVPLANILLTQSKTAIAGRIGYYRTVTATVKVVTAHSRTTRADGNGWPSGGPP